MNKTLKLEYSTASQSQSHSLHISRYTKHNITHIPNKDSVSPGIKGTPSRYFLLIYSRLIKLFSHIIWCLWSRKFARWYVYKTISVL